MYIIPNSIIKILRNVPLDSTYANTIHFNGSADQQAYFSGLMKFNETNYSYVREQRVLRVSRLADDLYDCNYIMFQNTAFGNKWFYAFITNIEYVNNSCSAISFEVDVMQTWYFDYTVLPSFVEREHSATDNIGDNLVPDNLETGDYKCFDFIGTGHIRDYKIVVAATFDEELNDVAGAMYSGIYSGITYNVFDNASGANDFINRAVENNKQSGIVSVFMMPSDFIKPAGQAASVYNIEIPRADSTIDGYTPKNKKLFTYPYNFLYVTNLNGVGTEYHYEYFTGGDELNFGVAGDMSCNPQVVLFPMNYKGLTANYNEKMVLDGFPQCSYNTDAFKGWLAQNGASTLITGLGGMASIYSAVGGAGAAVGAGVGIATGGTALLAVGGLLAVTGVVSNVLQHYTLPPHAQSSQGSSTMTALRIKDFAFIPMSIRREFAMIIDEYWSMYGYPVHRVKIPNISNRPVWNYVKTINASITGSIPTGDMDKIKSIYDRGITFWKHGEQVGHYELDNSI